MCGFAGIFMLSGAQADLGLAQRMAERLTHRGPDDSGTFISSDGRCAIAFRRLAIIDPPLSHQPMTLHDADATIALNGEVYNFRALRRQLEAAGGKFFTKGDAEVALRLYERSGPGMLNSLDGMFALAIYDARASRLLLARDRLGQKPLWYAAMPDRIVFASEPKALLQVPLIDTEIAAEAITYYVSFGYIPAPHSIWRGIRKLAPGQFLTAETGISEPRRYWQALPRAAVGSRRELRHRVRDAVTEAVGSHMVSDVPIGAFLSGGLDSSVVLSAMCRHAGKAGGVRTFTAGFADARYDERAAARVVAEHFGTEHAEVLVHPEPAAATELIGRLYDEPMADSSALPTYLICRAAREHVKVLLTGDGGDEVFGGYDRYRALHLAATMGPLGCLTMKLAAAAIAPLPQGGERGWPARLRRFARCVNDPPAMQYLGLRSLFGPADVARLFDEQFARSRDLEAPARWFCGLYEDGETAGLMDEPAYAQRHDLLTYLPDDLLVKTDIASMACSLELRAPLLDHRLVELGLGLPLDMRIARRRGKVALREAFADALPRSTLQRPKRGFGLPLARWLREDLRPQVEETLLDRNFLDRGVFSRRSIHGLVNDHMNGRDDHSHRLWALVLLAMWLARQSA